MHTWSPTNLNNTDVKLLCPDLKQKLEVNFSIINDRLFPSITILDKFRFSDRFISNKNHLNLHYLVVPLG